MSGFLRCAFSAGIFLFIVRSTAPAARSTNLAIVRAGTKPREFRAGLASRFARFKQVRTDKSETAFPFWLCPPGVTMVGATWPTPSGVTPASTPFSAPMRAILRAEPEASPMEIQNPPE